jgi:hypothetical protein
MTPAAKSKAAKYGFLFGVIGFLTGTMLLCDCPGWFACAGVAAALPAIWGTQILRVAGVCLCIASFGAAALQFQNGRELDAHLRQLREKAQQPDSQR